MLSEWLQTNLDAKGMSQSALARDLTAALGRSIDRAAVNKMLKGTRKISADEMVAITNILEARVPVAVDKPAPHVRSVVVASHVQAGYWAETWEWADDDKYEIAVPSDPEMEGVRLYAAETRGPSMNRRWPEGTVVVFTNAIETQESPIAGKRYVIERKRASGEMEHTVKTLHKDDNGDFWLIPESTDPLHQAPISVRDGTGDDDEVRIVGRVRYAVTRE